MNILIRSFKKDFLYRLTGLVLFLYVLSRAYLLTFTHDESYTFLEFVRKDNWFPGAYDNMSANNHLLNTWLMIICNAVFGASELSLRLPNVIAFASFLYFSFRFTQDIKNNVVRYGLFLLPVLQPYLTDFFSVARGYGLSMALLMGSLFHFYHFLKGYEFRNSAIYCLLYAAFAALANFTLLNYFLLVSSVLFFLMACRILKPATANRREIIKQAAAVIFITASFLAFLFPLLISLKKAGCFEMQNYGEAGGLWTDTFKTLFKNMLYEKTDFHYAPVLLALSITAVWITGMSIFVYNLAEKKHSPDNSFLGFILLAVLFFILAAYISHTFFGIQYPKNRTGIFFIPFFFLAIIFILKSGRISQRIKIIFSLFAALPALLHFAGSINFHYTLEYKVDTDVKQAFIKIQEMESQEKKNISIGSNYRLFDIFNYYRFLRGMNNLEPVERLGLFEKIHHYYFVSPEDTGGLQMHLSELIHFYPESGMLLIRNRAGGQKMNIVFSKTENCEGDEKFPCPEKNIVYKGKCSCPTDPASNYTKAISFTVNDSLLEKKNILLTLRSMIWCEKIDADIHFVISFQHGDSIYSWQDSQFKYDIPAGRWQQQSFTRTMPAGVRRGDLVLAYLWNTGTTRVYADELELKAEELPF